MVEAAHVNVVPTAGCMDSTAGDNPDINNECQNAASPQADGFCAAGTGYLECFYDPNAFFDYNCFTIQDKVDGQSTDDSFEYCSCTGTKDYGCGCNSEIPDDNGNCCTGSLTVTTSTGCCGSEKKDDCGNCGVEGSSTFISLYCQG